MCDGMTREELLDSAARHIADKLCITHAFAQRKLRQYIAERAISSGQAVLDSDLPELAAEVVNIELAEQRRRPTDEAQVSVAGDEHEGGVISAVHHHALQKENVRLLDEVAQLKAEKHNLNVSLEAQKAIAYSASGEVEGLTSSIEVIVGALLARVGPIAPQINFRTEVNPQ